MVGCAPGQVNAKPGLDNARHLLSWTRRVRKTVRPWLPKIRCLNCFCSGAGCSVLVVP